MSDLDITRLTSLKIKGPEITDLKKINFRYYNTPEMGTLVLGNFTTAEAALIVNNPHYDPAILPEPGKNNYPIANGTVIYNTDQKCLVYYYDGQGVNSSGSVSGPFMPLVKANTIAVFDDATGQYIVSTSVDIERNAEEIARDLFYKNNLPINTLDDFSYLNLSSFTYLDQKLNWFQLNDAVAFIINGHGEDADARFCVTFRGDVNDTAISSSPSAIIEIKEGALLLSRFATVDKIRIKQAPQGLVVFDTTLNNLSWYNGTTWCNPLPVPAIIPTDRSVTTIYNLEGTAISRPAPGKQVFDDISKATYNDSYLPLNVTSIKFTIIGGGGGGSGGVPQGATGSGGGSGSLIIGYCYNLTNTDENRGPKITWMVGAGGPGVGETAKGHEGGVSILIIGENQLCANGGKPGGTNGTNGAGGAGGSIRNIHTITTNNCNYIEIPGNGGESYRDGITFSAMGGASFLGGLVPPALLNPDPSSTLPASMYGAGGNGGNVSILEGAPANIGGDGGNGVIIIEW